MDAVRLKPLVPFAGAEKVAFAHVAVDPVPTVIPEPNKLAVRAYEMFRAGKDTYDIGRALRMHESKALKLVGEGRAYFRSVNP